jgi:hypothetical protein
MRTRPVATRPPSAVADRCWVPVAVLVGYYTYSITSTAAEPGSKAS